ncbi:MAG: serine hydrolase domain-containing protein [Microbacterium sp.]
MRAAAKRGSRRAAVAAALVVGSLVAATACTPDQTSDEPSVEMADAKLSSDAIDQMTTVVEHGMAAAGAPGAIVAVWVPWAGTWEAGIGTTVPDGDEVTTDMHFRIGDVTRAMTCDVLYDLVDEGKVSLSDSVSQHVPSAPNLTDVTLQQLCDGTSGLPDGRSRTLSAALSTPEREWAARELAATGVATPGRAGVEVADSDTAYELLGIALENITTTSARDLLKNYVFDPLGLENTTLPTDAPATAGTPLLPGLRSSAYDVENGCVAPHDYSVASASFGFTDSGVTSTIDDLASYGQSLAVNSVDSTGAFIDRWSNLLPFEDVEYGGGTFVAGSLVGQEGTFPGYLTAVYADTSTGLTVAVVLNNSAADQALVGAVAKELAAIASKLPAAEGFDQPELGLPWTADQQHAAVEAAAVCPLS